MTILMRRGLMVAALMLLGLSGAKTLWWSDAGGVPTVVAQAQAQQATSHAWAVATEFGESTESDTLTPACEPERARPASSILQPAPSPAGERSGGVVPLRAKESSSAGPSVMAVAESPAVRCVPGAGGAMACEELDERAMQEILDLRGDQGSLFRGTCLEGAEEGSEEAAFLAALRRAASLGSDDEGAGADIASSAVQSVVPSLLHEGGGADCHSQVAVSEFERCAEPGSVRELVATLRLAARQLDEQAAVLEEQRRYKAADTARGQAKRLRRYARLWDAEVLGTPTAEVSVRRFKRPHSGNFRAPEGLQTIDKPGGARP